MSTTAVPLSVTSTLRSRRREAENRLLELKAVVDQLRSVLCDEPARLWLRCPNPDLDWRKPLELITVGARCLSNGFPFRFHLSPFQFLPLMLALAYGAARRET